MEDIDLTGDSKVFINHIFCPYYRILWLKPQMFLNMWRIKKLMVLNGTVKVKISEISAPITHSNHFTKYFPDINLSLNVQSD